MISATGEVEVIGSSIAIVATGPKSPAARRSACEQASIKA